MSRRHSKQIRVLAISPSSRGFGFAVFEGTETLVDWGVKSVSGDKNAQSVAKVQTLVDHYQPELVVLPDSSDEQARRSVRVRTLLQEIASGLKTRAVKLRLLSHVQVRRKFLSDNLGTKHAVAMLLAQRFPEELGSRLPAKRRAWTSEDYRMDIFDAAALGLAAMS